MSSFFHGAIYQFLKLINQKFRQQIFVIYAALKTLLRNAVCYKAELVFNWIRSHCG